MTPRVLLWAVCTSLATVMLLGALIAGGSLLPAASGPSVCAGDELGGSVSPEAPSKSCTSLVVGKGASADGSTMVTFTADCADCDFRLVYVPEKDHASDEMRPVFPFGPYGLSYPRIVSEERAPGYAPEAGQEPTKPIGYIPEVEHTYAYLDGIYGVMNEHQLAIGETTASAKTYIEPRPEGGPLFDTAALSKVAMERCKTARSAIELMGRLAEEHGYYGWGETLTVIDPNEAWVFEIVPAPAGKSAVWVAQRVPDDEVAVVPNMLVIRDIDPSSPDFMMSDNVFDIARARGWWTSGTPLDFLRAYTPGEYNHPYYSLRRTWRAYDLLAPSRGFDPWVKDAYTKEYPFSIKPDRKVSVADLFRIQRDYYEGTEFDPTQGVAAGPFGTPNRYGEGEGEQSVVGAWERPISLFRCSYSYVLQARDWLPDPIGGLVWWGPDAPHSTVYVPFYAGMTEVPASYSTGSLREFSHASAWWAFDFVSNWADLKFSYMIQDIREKQSLLEGKAFREQSVVEQTAATMYETDPDSAREYLTDYCVSHAEDVVAQWWDFSDHLITKYHDGYVNIPEIGKSVGYPAWWLEAVEYDKGPTQYREP
jgi:dipeptidase